MATDEVHKSIYYQTSTESNGSFTGILMLLMEMRWTYDHYVQRRLWAQLLRDLGVWVMGAISESLTSCGIEARKALVLIPPVSMRANDCCSWSYLIFLKVHLTQIERIYCTCGIPILKSPPTLATPPESYVDLFVLMRIVSVDCWIYITPNP